MLECWLLEKDDISFFRVILKRHIILRLEITRVRSLSFIGRNVISLSVEHAKMSPEAILLPPCRSFLIITILIDNVHDGSTSAKSRRCTSNPCHLLVLRPQLGCHIL